MRKALQALTGPMARIALAIWLGLFAISAFPERASADPPAASLRQLPREVATTLQLVREGGPFPYRRDDIEFQNRERRLPQRARGYYREYTVPTPGARDRGARRLITGRGDEFYYSADHYRSFVKVTP